MVVTIAEAVIGPTPGIVSIRFVAARSLNIRQQISRQCLELLQEVVLPINDVAVQITVNVDEFDPAIYSKYPEGTLTPQN